MKRWTELEAIARRRGWVVQTAVPIAPWTTLRIGGVVPWVVWPRCVEEAAEILETLTRLELPWRVLGGGANVLVPDQTPLPWVIVKLDRLNSVKVEDGRLDVDAGMSAPRLSAWAARRGYGGLEFMSGIPGQVGGLVWMNAGAFGQAMDQLVEGVWLWDPAGAEVRYETPTPDAFGYRRSPYQTRPGVVLLRARLRIPGLRPPSEIMATLRQMKAHRLQTQPLQKPSAGCAFRNPEACPAGRLIDEAGLKGYRVGDAMISPRHANFIVNTGRATWSDVVRLMERVQTRIWNLFHIWLEPEMVIWSASDCQTKADAF